LSLQALRYGQHLDIKDVRTLAARLYAFNRHALSPAWGRRLPTRQSTARYLGLGDDATRPPSLGWVTQGATEEESSWLAWRSTVPVKPQHDKPGYKLYVSPQPSMVAESLRITAEVVHKRRAHGLKVGADVHGLLRPDKIVAYFTSFEDLGEAASSLAPRLAGVPAHGVPFTAEISADGLLSWGIDPPPQERTRTWEGESWRLWVVRRLASALVASRSALNAGETWVPGQGMFAARTGA
jgi:hypothetical protein